MGQTIIEMISQRILTVRGSIAVQLLSSLTRLDLPKKEIMLLFVCSVVVESKLVKPGTSRTAKLPPMVSVLWISFTEEEFNCDFIIAESIKKSNQKNGFKEVNIFCGSDNFSISHFWLSKSCFRFDFQKSNRKFNKPVFLFIFHF